MFAACLFTAAQVSAQTPEDILRFSQYNQGFGTARSAAMGGAFASLGADLSAMSINPAGLGMYRRSEIGISPSFTSMQVKTSIADQIAGTDKLTRNRFSLNNVGAAFNVYNGGGSLTSVTLGFGYSKMLDLNYHSKISANAGNNTRLDMWGQQLAERGVKPPTNANEMLNPDDFKFDEWGAVNAYNSQIIRYDWDANAYHTDGMFDENTRFSYDYLRKNKGYVGQYDLSAGFNIMNKFYFGLGFGFQDLDYTQNYTYSEYTENNSSNKLNQYHYNTRLNLTGSAWNFKVGVIVRPIEELRLALAFHTPTYISIDDTYVTRTDAYFNNAQSEWAQIQPNFVDQYNMRTPPRLIAGASYNFYNMAILSVDYERVWYNNMKAFRDNWDEEDTYVSTKAKEWYRPTNNIRVGLETVLANNIFGRLGYAFYDSYYKNSDLQDYAKVSNYSAGLGYRTSSWGVDLAYIFMNSKDAPDRAYEYNTSTRSDLFTAKNMRHNVTATLSFRF